MTGQFLSVDPDVGSTGTPFAYGEDDPIANVDPTGDWWCLPKSKKGSCPRGYTDKPPYNMKFPKPSWIEVQKIHVDHATVYEVTARRSGDQWIVSASGRWGDTWANPMRPPPAQSVCVAMQHEANDNSGQVVGGLVLAAGALKEHVTLDLIGADGAAPYAGIFAAGGASYALTSLGLDALVNMAC